jgi:hypothetical protein
MRQAPVQVENQFIPFALRRVDLRRERRCEFWQTVEMFQAAIVVRWSSVEKTQDHSEMGEEGVIHCLVGGLTQRWSLTLDSGFVNLSVETEGTLSKAR